MLTRIEIDGFKTFRRFSLDLRPFNVIAGSNASGKSNLFDAIQLLARLADGDLRSAVSGLRGEPSELFHRSPDGTSVDRIALAVETLLGPSVRDPWGDVRTLVQTRVRYEVVLERRRDERGLERLFVTHEAAKPIRGSRDTWAKPYRDARSGFVRAHLRYGRRNDLLDIENAQEGPLFRIGQDGHAGRKRPAVAAEATVLSSMRTAEFPHLYALREEIRSWRFLQLDPGGLRRSVDHHAPDVLEPSGWNLAAVLARIQAETATDLDPDGLLTDLSADLAHLIPGVTGVRVRDDELERQWHLLISARGGTYSGRVASDGTLRLLALLTALSDPEHGGVICFEEPENGIHPGRISPLLSHLRELVTDPYASAGEPVDPLLQLIVTTHSPVVVNSLKPSEGVFFEMATAFAGTGAPGDSVTRAREMRREIQQTINPDDVGHLVTYGEVERYLATAHSE